MRSGLPAKSVVERYDAARARDRRAMEALRQRDEEFTVPGFCAELSRLLAEEERLSLYQDTRRHPPSC